MKRLEDIYKIIIDEIHSIIPDLNEDSISFDKGFMEMGIESLQATHIVGNISQKLNINIDITALFDRPNLRSLSEYIYELLQAKNISENSNLATTLTSSQTSDLKMALQLNENKTSWTKFEDEKIAVIGMSCRFPGATNLEEFFQLLYEGKCAVKVQNHQRWKSSSDSINIFGAIDNIDEFAPEVFSITELEAKSMDPQQRLLLEQTWLAIEDAGITLNELKGKSVGVYVGISSHDYSYIQMSENRSDIFSVTGNSQSIAANRISYVFDFKGPSMAIDTACSSSLVALDRAVKDLRSGEIEFAVVGGVNLLLTPQLSTAFKDATMLSPDGLCKTFSDQANGYVRGEGVGVILLTSKSVALDKSYRSYSHILTTSVNQDGKSSTLTAPNGTAQECVIKSALAKAQLSPQDIIFHEAHGTGTSLGDPIEALALERVHKDRELSDKLILSSVKTNIGHLEAAAGIAGVIKSCLQIYNKILFPSLHFKNWNSLLVNKVNHLEVITKSQKWNQSKQLRGSVSSFGFGGTNAHVILEEAPRTSSEIDAKKGSFDYIYGAFSANDSRVFSSVFDSILKKIQNDNTPEVKVALSGSLTRRTQLEEQVYFYADSKANLYEVIQSIKNRKNSKQYFFRKKSNKSRKVALLFTGQGSQYPKMFYELYQIECLFKNQVDALMIQAQKYFPKNLYQVWQENIEETNYAQVLLFILEYSFARFLTDKHQLKFDITFGHSLGEIVALAVAGFMNIEQALTLVCCRAHCMQQSQPGAMIVVFTPIELIQEILATEKIELDLAANNGPELQVLSGEEKQILKLSKLLEERKIRCQLMSVKQAFHSKLMEGIVPPFRDSIKNLTYSAPEKPLLSSVTGTIIENSDSFSADYWSEQIRKPTQFYKAIKALQEWGVDTFIEIGPKAVLNGMAQRFVSNSKIEWISFIDPKEKNLASISLGLLKCFSLGLVVADDLDPYEKKGTKNYQLTQTQFFKKKYWIGRGVTMETKINQSEVILKNLAEILANTMRVSVDEVPVDESLVDLGADSLVLLNAVQIIKDTYNVAIPISEVFKDLNTLRKIADYISSTTSGAEPNTISSSSVNIQQSNSVAPVNAVLENIAPANADIMTILNNQLAIMQNQIALLSGASHNSINNISTSTPAISRTSSSIVTGASEISNKETPRGQGASHQLEGLEKEKRGVLGNFRSYVVKEKNEEDDKTKKEFLTKTISSINQMTSKTKEQVQKYRRYLADNRVSAGFRPNTKEMIYPIHCVKAKGSEFYDIDGNKFLDFTMGFGVNLFGHSPDFINEEMKKQFELGLCVGPQSHLAGEVAQLFCELTGSERVAFVNSGTEAVMTAIRLARAATKKSKIVIFDGSYHGHFDGVLAKGSKNISSMPVAAGITQNIVNDVIVLEYGNDKSLEIIKERASELAAVIVEPVQSRFPELQPKEFLKKLRAITENNQVAFIWDEVITGFRIAPGGAQEYFGIKADLASYGKVLGGGMPIGAVGGAKKYLDFIDGGYWQFGDESMPENEMTFFAGTFCKHPLAMASSLATLNKLKAEGKSIIDNLNKSTDELTARLNKMFGTLGVDIVVYNFGTLFRFKGSVNLDLLFTKLIEKGIYIWEGRNCFLSTAHTEQQLGYFVESVKQATEELIANKFYQSSLASQKKTQVQSKELIPLIPSQKRFINIEQSGELSHRANNICVSAKVKGHLDVNKLQKAIEYIATQRDIYRWSLDTTHNSQHFSENSKPIDFEFINLRSIPRPWRILDNHLLEISKTKFDLVNQAPMFVKVFDVVEETHLLVVVAHHLAFDGWSMTLFFEDLATVYNSLLEGKEVVLRKTLDYKQYLSLVPSVDIKAEAALLNKYQGQTKNLLFAESLTSLDYNGERIVFDIELKVYESLKKWCKINKYTPFMLLFATFAKALMQKFNKKTLTIGIPAANRDIPGSEVMYGNCANLVPVTLTASERPILEFVSDVKAKMIEGYQTMTYPYELLKEKTGAVFDVYFNLEPTSDLPELNEASLLIHPFVISASEFPLMLNITDFENYYHCEMDFQKAKITDDEVLSLIELLRRSLKEELMKIDFTQFNQSMLQAKR